MGDKGVALLLLNMMMLTKSPEFRASKYLATIVFAFCNNDPVPCPWSISLFIVWPISMRMTIAFGTEVEVRYL